MERIHQREFPLPNLADKSYIVQGALVDRDDKLEGAYFARVTSEIILILKEDLSPLKRARFLKEAARDLLRTIPAISGIKSTHVFVTPETDTYYEKFLAKHFGFVRATGIPLYWEIE